MHLAGGPSLAHPEFVQPLHKSTLCGERYSRHLWRPICLPPRFAFEDARLSGLFRYPQAQGHSDDSNLSTGIAKASSTHILIYSPSPIPDTFACIAMR